MKTLIVENRIAGHYFLYLSHLLPPLANLAERVDVALTREGLASREFEVYLAPLKDRVNFHPILPLVNPTDRLKLHLNLRSAVSRLQPQYVLVPSGDAETSAMGLFRALGRGGLPGRIQGEVGIHYGSGATGTGSKDRLKDLFYLATQECSTWKKLHFANLLFYERAKAWGGTLARRAELMPAPVPGNPRLGRHESRRSLGLPEEGRYIGVAALLDERKGIDRLLAAFRIAANPSDRLLLAGRLAPTYRQLIDRDYADLVRQERLIVFDRFVDDSEFQIIMSALDVVAATSPNQRNRSLTLLHAIAAATPVLVSDIGWMKAMVSRFGFGRVCNVYDRDAYAAAIRQSLDQSPDYRESESTRRLLDFYSPPNLVAHWLKGIRRTMGDPSADQSVSWESVLESLKVNGPATFGAPKAFSAP